MALETNKTYDDLMVTLKKEFNDLKDKRCWRDVNIIQKMPFYETKFHPEYFVLFNLPLNFLLIEFKILFNS